MDQQTPFPSNLQIHNYDISILYIETRGLMGLLYRRLARRDGDIIGVYNQCIYSFAQLYDMVKHVIRKSGKIEDWDKREEIYQKLLDQIQEGLFDPDKLIKFWRFLSSDIVNSGIYNEDENKIISTLLRISGSSGT